jgi:predicted transcriptional regulator
VIGYGVARPTKPKSAHARPLSITLPPEIHDELEDLARDLDAGNKSATIARLIADESARRTRRRRR